MVSILLQISLDSSACLLALCCHCLFHVIACIAFWKKKAIQLYSFITYTVCLLFFVVILKKKSLCPNSTGSIIFSQYLLIVFLFSSAGPTRELSAYKVYTPSASIFIKLSQYVNRTDCGSCLFLKLGLHFTVSIHVAF